MCVYLYPDITSAVNKYTITQAMLFDCKPSVGKHVWPWEILPCLKTGEG